MNPEDNSANSQQAIVKLQGVTLTRGSRTILDALSLEIDADQKWVVIGPNGAGKTSIARIIAGRDYADSGSIEIFGAPLGSHEATDLASRVGFASAEVGLGISPVETVSSVVLTAAWGQTISFGEGYEATDRQRADDLLESMGIGHLRAQTFSTLSEGERRRVLLARALMADPELLILDEPTAGLDLGGREILVTAMAEIMRGPNSPNVILITHELESIGPDFTHALLLDRGSVVAAGAIEGVLTSRNLSGVFGIDLKVEHAGGRWRATTTGRL